MIGTIFTQAFVLAFSVASFALDGQLKLHLECAEINQGCVQITLDGKSIATQSEPALTIGARELDDVALVFGENEAQLFNLRLKEEAAQKLAELTKNNIGRRLVIIENGTALIAPVIRDAITDGAFQISNPNKGWDSLPWLRRAAEDRMPSATSLYLQTFAMLAVLGSLIGLPIYYLRRKGKRSISPG